MPVGVQCQAIIIGGLFQARPQLVEILGWQCQRYVLQCGHGFEKREVLKHHADAQRTGSGGVGYLNRVTVPANLPLIRAQYTVDDLYQGAFAGTVFSQQGVDLTRDDLQADIVVGKTTRKLFADALQLQ